MEIMNDITDVMTMNNTKTTATTITMRMIVEIMAERRYDANNGTDNLTAASTTLEGDDNSAVVHLDPNSTSKTALISCIMFGCGLAGNLIALLLMATSPTDQRQTTFYKLMACLALTDLVGTCTTSPVVISTYIRGTEMQDGSLLCHYFSFMMIFAGFSTMSLVCAMSIERYICVCHPYIYQCKLSKSSYPKFAIAVALLLPFLVASLPLLGLGHNTVQFPNTWCFFDSISYRPTDIAFSFIYAGTCLVSILVTFFCNMTAFTAVLTMKRHQRHLHASQHGTNSSSSIRVPRSITQRFAELHMIVMLLGVTTIFIACYGPLVVNQVFSELSFEFGYYIAKL